MKQLFLTLYNWFFAHSLYVVADPNDSSVTLSERLCKHIGIWSLDKCKVFVFSIPETGNYGFVINPNLNEESTQMSDIQYNDKHKCIGFETLCPTVARIFYDYGINCHASARLTVKVRHTHNMYYYEILKPYEESLRAYTEARHLVPC